MTMAPLSVLFGDMTCHFVAGGFAAHDSAVEPHL